MNVDTKNTTQEDINHATASMLRDLRKRKNITVKRMAIYINCSEQHIYKLEKGQVNITVQLLSQYVRRCDYSMEIFCRELQRKMEDFNSSNEVLLCKETNEIAMLVEYFSKLDCKHKRKNALTMIASLASE